MPLRVIQHYSDWVCTAVMSNDVMKDLHNVITHNRGTNPVTIILFCVFYKMSAISKRLPKFALRIFEVRKFCHLAKLLALLAHMEDK